MELTDLNQAFVYIDGVILLGAGGGAIECRNSIKSLEFKQVHTKLCSSVWHKPYITAYNTFECVYKKCMINKNEVMMKLG
jgi:hypothetical protein